MKLVTETVKEPSAAAATDCEVPTAEATFTPAPHGAFVEGRVTSDRAGVPVTPRAGEMSACAEACAASARREKRALDLTNIVKSRDVFEAKKCDEGMGSGRSELCSCSSVWDVRRRDRPQSFKLERIGRDFEGREERERERRWGIQILRVPLPSHKRFLYQRQARPNKGLKTGQRQEKR